MRRTWSRPGFFYSTPLHIIVIVLLGILVYSNTFDVPFFFDDIPNTTESPFIKDISNVPAYFAVPRGPWASRPLMHATLAVNYYMGGFSTWGYHALNLSVHILNGILLYFLIVMTGRHRGYDEKDTGFVAVLSALLFVVHPVQTQAVTYITSRSMLFATTFYLSGLILFLKAVTLGKGRGLYTAGLFLVSLFGMASRENFATFPIMLFLYDMFFISRFRLREAAGHWRAHLPVLLSLGYVAYLVLGNTYDRGTDFPGTGVPNLEYFFTQFDIHWTYLRLLVLPVGQHLDYDYPIAKTLFEFPTILSCLGYLALWAVALALSRKRPVVSFSMLWFLITLLPISFLVAFMDLRFSGVMFEHRLYLPSVGVFVATVSGAVMLSGRYRQAREGVLVLFIVAALIFSAAAYMRNTVWQSGISLWEDVVRKSPANAKAHNNLGIAYKTKGMTDKAIEHYLIALELEPDMPKAHFNLANVYSEKGMFGEAVEEYLRAIEADLDFALAHFKLGNVYGKAGQLDRAIEHYLIALNQDVSSVPARYFSMAHANLAEAYDMKGQHEKAMEHYESAIRFDLRHEEAYNNMGDAYARKGLIDEAIECYLKAIEADPDYAPAHFNLANVYREKGMTGEAVEEYLRAIEVDPGYVDAHINLGIIYKKTGRTEEAIESYKHAIRLEPDRPEVHFNIGNAYMMDGQVESAIEHYEHAIGLNSDDPAVHKSLALAYQRKGMPQKAREHRRIAEGLGQN